MQPLPPILPTIYPLRIYHRACSVLRLPRLMAPLYYVLPHRSVQFLLDVSRPVLFTRFTPLLAYVPRNILGFMPTALLPRRRRQSRSPVLTGRNPAAPLGLGANTTRVYIPRTGHSPRVHRLPTLCAWHFARRRQLRVRTPSVLLRGAGHHFHLFILPAAPRHPPYSTVSPRAPHGLLPSPAAPYSSY